MEMEIIRFAGSMVPLGLENRPYHYKHRLAGSFFSSGGEGQRSKIARLIPTLSHQLALTFVETKPLIRLAIENTEP
jgi:predicted ABC-type transport system involved in lysophospholipase L1 biosynthesis ATPase subunit